jgi:GH18 family chitinase
MYSDSHRKQFIQALVSETVRLKLDGVDIDFEGKGNRDSDKKPFFDFIKELSFALRGKGKELTGL